MEKDIRDLLKEKEFERTIAYITEIFEVKDKIKELQKEQEKDSKKIKILQGYHNDLEILIAKHMEFVLKDHDFKLEQKDIQISFLKEYIYILSKKERYYGCEVNLGDILKDKSDLAMIILETYGRKKEKLFKDIVNTKDQNSLPRYFEEYFPE